MSDRFRFMFLALTAATAGCGSAAEAGPRHERPYMVSSLPPHGPYGFELVDESGGSLPAFGFRGRFYVAGETGRADHGVQEVVGRPGDKPHHEQRVDPLLFDLCGRQGRASSTASARFACSSRRRRRTGPAFCGFVTGPLPAECA